jgi:hypothetical protein
MRLYKRGNGRTSRVVADDEVEEQTTAVAEEAGDVDVAPEAVDLLFEATDVAEVIAEITNEDVEVDTDDETGEVVISVGEGENKEEYVVTPDGDEEFVESSKRVARKATVKASRKPARRPMVKRPVSASKKVARPVRSARTVRKISK